MEVTYLTSGSKSIIRVTGSVELHEAGLTSETAIRRYAAETGTLPAPLPGPLAYGACGVVGLVCVVVAGWTTANPTIYRAGLAFQAIVPRRSRLWRAHNLNGLWCHQW